jgi:hypothetical protein
MFPVRHTRPGSGLACAAAARAGDRIDGRPADITQVTGAQARLQGQASLADPPGTDHGDKSLSLPEQRPDLVQLSFPADERGQWISERTGARYIPLADKAIRSGILCLVHASIMARAPVLRTFLAPALSEGTARPPPALDSDFLI